MLCSSQYRKWRRQSEKHVSLTCEIGSLCVTANFLSSKVQSMFSRDVPLASAGVLCTLHQQRLRQCAVAKTTIALTRPATAGARSNLKLRLRQSLPAAGDLRYEMRPFVRRSVKLFETKVSGSVCVLPTAFRAQHATPRCTSAASLLDRRTKQDECAS
jgi:hypothetical protein